MKHRAEILKSIIAEADKLSNEADECRSKKDQISEHKKAIAKYKEAYAYKTEQLTAAEKLEITQGLLLCYDTIIEVTKDSKQEKQYSKAIIDMLAGRNKQIAIESIEDVRDKFDLYFALYKAYRLTDQREEALIISHKILSEKLLDTIKHEATTKFNHENDKSYVDGYIKNNEEVKKYFNKCSKKEAKKIAAMASQKQSGKDEVLSSEEEYETIVDEGTDKEESHFDVASNEDEDAQPKKKRKHFIIDDDIDVDEVSMTQVDDEDVMPKGKRIKNIIIDDEVEDVIATEQLITSNTNTVASNPMILFPEPINQPLTADGYLMVAVEKAIISTEKMGPELSHHIYSLILFNIGLSHLVKIANDKSNGHTVASAIIQMTQTLLEQALALNPSNEEIKSVLRTFQKENTSQLTGKYNPSQSAERIQININFAHRHGPEGVLINSVHAHMTTLALAFPNNALYPDRNEKLLYGIACAVSRAIEIKERPELTIVLQSWFSDASRQISKSINVPQGPRP